MIRKLKENINSSFARAKTMSESEKKLNSLIMKMVFKKTSPYLISMIATVLAGSALDINIFVVLVIETIIAIGIYKKTKKISKEFNDFKLYQGNIISMQTDNKTCNLVIKQGKTPVRIEINHLIEDFKNLKRNDFVRISYNKDKKIAMLYKQ